MIECLVGSFLWSGGTVGKGGLGSLLGRALVRLLFVSVSGEAFGGSDFGFLAEVVLGFHPGEELCV